MRSRGEATGVLGGAKHSLKVRLAPLHSLVKSNQIQTKAVNKTLRGQQEITFGHLMTTLEEISETGKTDDHREAADLLGNWKLPKNICLLQVFIYLFSLVKCPAG